MTNYLNEAFQKLSLVEDDFNFSARDTGVADELKSFVADDIDIVDEEPIIDVEADSTDDLQDTYVGKVIIECDCCHGRIFKNRADVVIDEETGLANIDEACPVCGEKGWNVVGKIEEFEPKHEDEEEEAENFFKMEKGGSAGDAAAEAASDAFGAAMDELDADEEKENKKSKKKKKKDEEEEVEESLKEAFEEAYGDCEDCGDDIPMEENAIMDRVRAKMELGESEEKFPDPSKHDYVKTVEGTKMYYCNDCGKYAAKIDGKKVKADSEEELEKKIKKGAGALKEGINMNKLRRKLEMAESCEDCDDDFEEAFDPERVRAKLEMGEGLEESSPDMDKIRGRLDDQSSNKKAPDMDKIRGRLSEDAETDRPLEISDTNYIDDHDKWNFGKHKEWKKKEIWNSVLRGLAGEERTPTDKNALLRSRGEIARDNYRDYERKYDKPFDDFEEAFDPERVRAKLLGEALHVEADGEDKVTVDKADDGSMDIHVGPGADVDFPADDIPIEDTEGLEAGDEMIAPLSDEEEEEIKANTSDEEDEFGEEEAPEDEESDENIDDFDEESFDNMGESYVRRVYEDVEAYKTTNVAVNESQLIVEGLITMRSGATKPTKFVFENATMTKRGKLVLEGMNTTFSNKKNAFVLKGTLTEGKFTGESMLYKYPARALNESKQMETYLCSGRVIAKKK